MEDELTILCRMCEKAGLLNSLRSMNGNGKSRNYREGLR